VITFLYGLGVGLVLGVIGGGFATLWLASHAWRGQGL
jgi:hypothetical protein